MRQSRPQMVSGPDTHGLDGAEQARADRLVAELEAEVNGATSEEPGVSALLDEERFPSLAPWILAERPSRRSSPR